MSIIAWIILGLAASFVNKEGEDFFFDNVLVIVDALVGSFIFSVVGASGITGFNLYCRVHFTAR
jgi:uncharacterized membrane protein YeaQ/YmgE (transglycosylase-associated protein family)